MTLSPRYIMEDPTHLRDRMAFLTRRKLMKRGIQSFFDARDFDEVETPYAVMTPGEDVHLLPFTTVRFTPDGQEHILFLHTSPELAMKRIVAATGRSCYQLARVWRNAENSAYHSSEFTMLEWYHVNLNFDGLMDEVESLLRCIMPIVVERNGVSLRFDRPFERLTLQDAFYRYVGVDLLSSCGQAEKLAWSAGVPLRDNESWDDLFFRLMLEKIEPYIGRECPIFLSHWPLSQAALARRDENDSRVSLRFELYAGGIELANGFEELTDSEEQRRRFEHDRQKRRRLYPQKGRVWPLDEEFLASLRFLPPCSGVAVGFDRLVMLATGASRIQDVVWLSDNLYS